jgi:hypothetical protein
MSDLTNLGFRLVYNYTYGRPTTSAEILSIRSQCNPLTIICVGGNRYDETFLRVVACANCLNVTTQTLTNQPQKYGAVYWYFTENQSFGYAPNSTITQNSADNYDENSNFRLSWHLQGNGGWRLGNVTSLNSDTNYYKKAYINGNRILY